MFPKKSVIRFDFPARGSMPAVKLFWHDGLKQAPKIDRVPEGALLGDIRRPRRPQQQQGGAPALPSGTAAGPTGFVGQVFDPNQQYEMSENDGSLSIGDKGMITTGTYGE